jgi:hypothetical protein
MRECVVAERLSYLAPLHGVITAWQLCGALAAAEAKISGKRLSEGRVLEALEEVCAGVLLPKTLGTGTNQRVVPQDWGEYWCVLRVRGEIMGLIITRTD